MSNEKPMGIAAKGPRVRYSAAYPTGREHIGKEELLFVSLLIDTK